MKEEGRSEVDQTRLRSKEGERTKDSPLSSEMLGKVGDESLEGSKHSSMDLTVEKEGRGLVRSRRKGKKEEEKDEP